MKTGVAFVKGVGFGFAVQKGNSNFLTGVTSSPPAALTVAATRATLDSSVRATAATQAATAVADQVLCACRWACRRTMIANDKTGRNTEECGFFIPHSQCSLISRFMHLMGITTLHLMEIRHFVSVSNCHLIWVWACKDDSCFCTFRPPTVWHAFLKNCFLFDWSNRSHVLALPLSFLCRKLALATESLLSKCEWMSWTLEPISFKNNTRILEPMDLAGYSTKVQRQRSLWIFSLLITWCDWWLVLIYYERKYCWLAINWCAGLIWEKNTASWLADKPSEQSGTRFMREIWPLNVSRQEQDLVT